MGMSASQARLLSLEARQSNLEYQGQQINQERTILSQQCTALYNSLLSMTVPTPPSTTDFTTVQYSGQDGATKFTLGTVTPENGGTYNVEIQYAKNGTALKGGSFANVKTYNEPEFLPGAAVSTELTTPTTTSYYVVNTEEEVNTDEIGATYFSDSPIMHSVLSADEAAKFDGADFYYQDPSSKKFIKASSYEEALKLGDGINVPYVSTTIGEVQKNYGDDFDWNNNNYLDYSYDPNDNNSKGSWVNGGITKEDFDNATYYDKNGNIIKFESLNAAGKNADGKLVYTMPDGAIKYDQYGEATGVKNPKYDIDQAKQGTMVDNSVVQEFSEDVLGTSYEEALKAIANSYPEYKNTSGGPDADKIAKTFSVIFKTNAAGTQVPYIIKTADYNQKKQMSGANGQNQIEIFSIEANGSYKDSIQTKGCKLTFDTSGRISEVAIPVTDAEGKETGKYNTIKLEASTVTDENAYKDAYAEYEYNTYLYDQKNKEINAKTEVIQQEDRNLELKLQRLDNERTQIKTEIEAVKKVITDNIESSYKTFSG